MNQNDTRTMARQQLSPIVTKREEENSNSKLTLPFYALSCASCFFIARLLTSRLLVIVNSCSTVHIIVMLSSLVFSLSYCYYKSLPNSTLFGLYQTMAIAFREERLAARTRSIEID